MGGPAEVYKKPLKITFRPLARIGVTLAVSLYLPIDRHEPPQGARYRHVRVPFRRGAMGNNSAQGLALLVLFVAFTLLSIGMFYEGSVVFLGLGLVTLAGAIAMFRKARPLEEQG
jgi:hypothetical protein